MIRSDMRNKEIALGRIKRLSSSGLPLEPFARTLFELFHDAIPHSPNRALGVARDDRADLFFASTREVVEMVPNFYTYCVERPDIPGKMRQDPVTLRRLLPTKTVWLNHDFIRPDTYRTEGYDVVFRPLGWHHLLQVTFEEDGNLAGHYPFWRAPTEKPFTHEDGEFLRAAAPHVTHGLLAAQLLERKTSQPDDGLVEAPGWGSGVVLMEPCGRLIAMDLTAQTIFHQLQGFDDASRNALESRPVQEALRYVSYMLQRIFGGSDWLSATAPVHKVHFHWTGITLRLRGAMMSGADGRQYITVLVERGETFAARQRRLQFRWGLSDREAEVLALVGQGKTGPAISILLSINHDTARKHLARVFEKLGVENRTEAALMLRDAS